MLDAMLMIKPFQWLMSIGNGNVTAQTELALKPNESTVKTNVSVHFIKFATLLSIENLYSIQIQAKCESKREKEKFDATMLVCGTHK